MDLWNNLGFGLCAVPFVCHVVATSDDKEKSEMEVSADLVCHVKIVDGGLYFISSFHFILFYFFSFFVFYF